MPNPSAISGCLLGTAVADAIGLPYEGMSRRRGQRMLGEPMRHRFVLGRGMVSDDTEHACMVAQSLVAAGEDVEAFSRQLGRRMRWWLLGLPAGVGWATLRATLKLWLGFPPSRSGVSSAGNGPAMRSAILGVVVEDGDLGRLLPELVRACTRITHADPKAEHGAFAVALAAQMTSRTESIIDGKDFLAELMARLGSDESADELLGLISQAVLGANRGESAVEFAASLGLASGVSGYVYHTVPVAIHAWLRHPNDFRAAVMDVIRCGGDTDTTAAIVGGIVGARVGKDGIPPDWLGRLWEWPRSVAWIERLAEQLSETRRSGETARPVRLPVLGVLLRNVLFLLIVLWHVGRRALPPY